MVRSVVMHCNAMRLSAWPFGRSSTWATMVTNTTSSWRSFSNGWATGITWPAPQKQSRETIYIYMWVLCRESWIWRKTCFLNYTAVKSLLSTRVGRIAEHAFSVVKHPDLAFLGIPHARIPSASGFWHVGFLRVPKHLRTVVGALWIQLSLSMFGTYSPSIPITQKCFRIALTVCSKVRVTFHSL